MWMRKSTHRREMINKGKAYRWEIEQANARTAKAQAELDRLLDVKAELIHDHFGVVGQRHALYLDCSDLAMSSSYSMPYDTAQRLAQRLLTTLMGLGRDHRPDMRQAGL